MAIYAESTSQTPKELVPAGTHIARCYQMIEIGTVPENIQGEIKHLKKVRLSFELPNEKRVFKEGEEEKPFVISKEFTLSLSEKANLRKFLDSWRGVPFTEEQARKFDISKLLDVPAIINVLHKTSKDGTKKFAEIAVATPLMKGFTCPERINPLFLLSYDEFDRLAFDTLPDFIKEKMKSSKEYQKIVLGIVDESPAETFEEPIKIEETETLPF